MLLFVAQPALVLSGATDVHRKAGWLGLTIAVAMVGLGWYAVLFGLSSGRLPPFYPPGLFLIRGAVGLLTFFGLVVAAIAYRRRPQWHKRLMLCATIVVTIPALERALPIPLLGAGWHFVVDGVVDVILMAGPIADIASRGRVHPAFVAGFGAVVLGQLATDLLARSEFTTAVLGVLGVH